MDKKITIEGIEYAHSDKLQQAMDKAIAEAEKIFPLFPYPSPFTRLKGEGESLKQVVKYGDESLDDLFGTTGYQITNGYLKIYKDELEKFGIDEMLLENTDLNIRDIISLVKHTGNMISEHSGSPTLIENRILDVLVGCDEYKQVGLIVQVLYLQGVLKWFEYCDLNEGDPGSIEAQNLVNWIYEKFKEACFFYFWILKNNNISKPLTDYLETLEIGQVWKEFEIKKELNVLEIENSLKLYSNTNEIKAIDKTESIEQTKKGDAPKKVVDESISLKSIMHEDYYTEAKRYYIKKVKDNKLKTDGQYGQLINEFIKKNWIKPEFKKITWEQKTIIMNKEFNMMIKPDAIRKIPNGNEFEDMEMKRIITTPL